jgi:hypothetical protein
MADEATRRDRRDIHQQDIPMNTRDNRNARRDDRSPGAAGAVFDAPSEQFHDQFRDRFRDASYYSTGRDWDDYAPAYRYGASAFAQHRGKHFEDIERILERNWDTEKPPSRLVWVEARGAVLDAWRQASQEAAAARPTEDASKRQD